MTDEEGIAAAIAEAEKGRREGGIPIGAALAIRGELVAVGRNRRVQEGDPILHAEMTCLRNAGRLRAIDLRDAVLYSTLSPCDMCSGAALLYRIPRVVIGENRSFQGPEAYVRSRGVELVNLDDARCVALMERFLKESPELWAEDIGV